MFAVYTRDAQGNRVSYEGPLLEINDASCTFEKDVQRLVEVLYHWVCLCLVTELVGSLLTRGITSSWQTAISRVIHFAKFSLYVVTLLRKHCIIHHNSISSFPS